MITTVEAFVLAVMTAIVVAIAIPSYLTIRDRDSDSAARSQLREAGEAAETYRADTGSYARHVARRSGPRRRRARDDGLPREVGA